MTSRPGNFSSLSVSGVAGRAVTSLAAAELGRRLSLVHTGRPLLVTAVLSNAGRCRCHLSHPPCSCVDPGMTDARMALPQSLNLGETHSRLYKSIWFPTLRSTLTSNSESLASDDNDGQSQDLFLCVSYSTFFCPEQSWSPGDTELTLPVEVQCWRSSYHRK